MPRDNAGPAEPHDRTLDVSTVVRLATAATAPCGLALSKKTLKPGAWARFAGPSVSADVCVCVAARPRHSRPLHFHGHFRLVQAAVQTYTTVRTGTRPDEPHPRLTH